MKDINVFIDLEGLVEISRNQPEPNFKKLEFIADELPKALNRQGYATVSMSAFAHYKRHHLIVAPVIQDSVQKVFTSRGWKMTWCSGIADLALIAEVNLHMANETLAQTIMLIANDHDFTDMVALVRKTTREVLVSGPCMSRRLMDAANRAIPFLEFMNIKDNDVLLAEYNIACQAMPVFNPISFGNLKI